MFNKKNILITGGTGSFGQEFVRTILKNFNANKIVIFSRDEFKQYNMKNKFDDNKHLRFFLGDIRDYERLKYALNDIDYVVHAAALKHVDAAEYNPTEYISTNINGAQNLIAACMNSNVKKIISLSTDKACSPINLYGATKLVSEKLFAAANNIKGKKKIIFSSVRYGNVINSRGSIIPYFMKLLKNKKTILPITNQHMTRFLITLEEAVMFVIKSFKCMQGGEVFIPKIPSISIVELVKLISPNSKQKIIGVRPGEKIHEILCNKDESQQVVEYKNYFLIKPSIEITRKINFYRNNYGETGKNVKSGFEYTSKESIKTMNKKKLLSYIKNIKC